MSSAASRLDRVRRRRGWGRSGEPRKVWLRGADDGSEVVALALAGIGAECIHIERPREASGRPILTHLIRDWLDDVHLELHDHMDPAVLDFALEAHEIDLFVDLGGGDGAGSRVALERNIPTYSARARGTELGFSFGGEELGLTSGHATLEAWVALAGALSHDVAARFMLGVPSPSPSFHLELADPWADAATATLRPPGAALPARVLVCGAGGLGCPIGLLLADLLAPGSAVVMADFDIVEPSNRNRQFLFSSGDAERGTLKPIAACRELERVNPDIEWIPLVAELPSPEAADHAPYDVVFTATDTIRSRLAVARMNLAPVVVNSGVTFLQASAALFHEDSPTLPEALGFDTDPHADLPQSCAQAAPSIVSTTLLGASLAVSLYRRHLREGPRPARLFEYDLLAPARGGAWAPYPYRGGSG